MRYTVIAESYADTRGNRRYIPTEYPLSVNEIQLRGGLVPCHACIHGDDVDLRPLWRGRRVCRPDYQAIRLGQSGQHARVLNLKRRCH